jgi:3-methyladenine DNA glycosylase AlkD
VKALRAEVRRALQAKVDAAYLQKIRELVPSGSPILGVRVPEIRELAKSFAARRPLGVDEVCALVDEQFAGRCREEILFGLFWLARFKKQLPPQLWSRIDRWIDCIDNWETCDQLAKGIAGELLARDLALVADVKKWARSPNPWRRRFAVAITTELNQKGRSDAEPALAVCKHLLTEADANVQKAVGWALREACKSDEPAVFELLRSQTVHPKILREAAQKLTAAHKRALGVK